MKIAVPTRDGIVDEHFGHCDHYTIYEVVDGKLGAGARLESPQGCGCKSNIASVLKEMGVHTMLAGNIGQGAVNVLSQSGINVVRGCNGKVEEVAEAFLAGKIKDQPIICDHHECSH
ncbi:NifB/NifX family molybdenum-iron cluster-binding protein [Paucidesulfovibrio longus]|uniref:NifB/NifX family molybdenum-iron cluster-binding protein n=1 Tax=Paucidesulfovibrio longus TaxID=889 RepID=UPI0003FE13F8|nr:NifB/NifX family molybdenum-iron cluster-binding protein [Paucidesulfovibrio longus]